VLWPVRTAWATVVVFGVSRYTGKEPTGRQHAGVTPKIRIPAGHSLSRLRSGFPPLLGACFVPWTRHHALHRSRRASWPSLPGTRRRNNCGGPSLRSLPPAWLDGVTPIHQDCNACRSRQDPQRDLQSRHDLQTEAGEIALSRGLPTLNERRLPRKLPALDAARLFCPSVASDLGQSTHRRLPNHLQRLKLPTGLRRSNIASIGWLALPKREGPHPYGQRSYLLIGNYSYFS